MPSSGGRFDDVDRRLRDPAEHRFQAGYTMATASAVPASAPYRPNPPASSYASSYASGAVQSSTESRRTSDESEHTHRRSQQSDMSLPPIHEALSAPAEGSRDPLRSLPPPHSFPSRAPPPEPLSSFPASSRSTLSTRANVPPPLPIFDMHQHQHQAPSQSYIGRDRDAEFRQAAEPPPPQLSGGYSHYPPQHNPPSQHPPPHYPQSGPRPPGQLPLPSLPPASPRQPGSAMISPSETGRPPYHPDEESARKRNNEGTLGRPFEGYPYLDALNKVSQAVFWPSAERLRNKLGLEGFLTCPPPKARARLTRPHRLPCHHGSSSTLRKPLMWQLVSKTRGRHFRHACRTRRKSLL